MGFPVKTPRWRLYIRARITCKKCGYSQDGTTQNIIDRMRKGEYDKCPKCRKRMWKSDWKVQILKKRMPDYASEKQKQLNELTGSFWKQWKYGRKII